MTPDFSPENVDSRQKWHNIFQMLKRKPCQSKCLYSQQYILRNKRKSRHSQVEAKQIILRICAPADVPFPLKEEQKKFSKEKNVTEEEALKPQTSRKKEHGDYRAELAVEGSALPHWSVGLPLFINVPGGTRQLRCSPVPTTYSRVILGKLPQI